MKPVKKKVELVYERTCPNVEAARNQLALALEREKLEPVWIEWEVSDAQAPGYVRGYGSPSILVDEQDVAAKHSGGCGNSCRLYCNEDGSLSVSPTVEQIIEALRR